MAEQVHGTSAVALKDRNRDVAQAGGNGRESGAGRAEDVACAAEGIHLHEGIADAISRFASGFGIGHDDTLAVALAQRSLRGFVVGGEIDGRPTPRPPCEGGSGMY